MGRVADNEGPLIPAAAVEAVVDIGTSLSAGGTGDDIGDISGVVGSNVAASPPVFDRTATVEEGVYINNHCD